MTTAQAPRPPLRDEDPDARRAPLVLQSVTKRFGASVVVDAISWAPRAGRVTALVGLNGAGKSTLMRVVTGLVAPSSGSVGVAGAGSGRAVSAMVEGPALFTALSVRRNLAIHRVLVGAGAAQVAAVVQATRVGEVLGRRVGALSQGYRQRVAIAVALLAEPAVLLLDEPTNALDPEALVHLRSLLRTVADSGTAVVVSSHLLRELDGVADGLTVLHAGRVLYDGPFAAFVGAPVLRLRATDARGTARLEHVLRGCGVAAVAQHDGVRVPCAGEAPDALAGRLLAAAAGAGLELVEVSHLRPSLEEAFANATAGVGA